MRVGWMNGKILKEEEMVLPVRDLGILRGYGVFDFLRTYGQHPFHLDDHLNRLKHSASQIALTIPYSLKEMEDAIRLVLKESDMEDAAFRIVCTGGASQDSMTSRQGVTMFILLDPIKIFPAEWYKNGVKIITYKHMRYRPETKSLNYIPAMEAMHLAEEAAAVEALYCDETKRILEGSTSNIFLCKNGRWFTPGRDILKGITRQVVINLIGKDNLHTGDLFLRDLIEADEVFITASSKEIMPVSQVDDHFYGKGPGPETLKLMTSFRDYVSSPEKWKPMKDVFNGSV